MSEINLNLQPGFTFGGWLPHIISGEEPSFSLEDNSQLSKFKEFFQIKAFLAAMKYASLANPNPSVGCVIVKNNQIISSGCTQIWKGLHAEKEAFDQVKGVDLKGADVYLTLEPCTHFGNQPPCIDLFRNRGINKVYISRADSNPIVKNNGIKILKEIGIDVEIGFFSKEVTAWNFPFFVQQKFQRPMIALKWAQSLDGCLADDLSCSKWISGEESRRYTHWLRQKYDSILVGARTFLTDLPSLDVRHIDTPYKRNPLRIVFDPKGSVLFCTKNEQNLVRENLFRKNSKTLFLIDKNMIREALSSSSEWSIELHASEMVKILPIINNELGNYRAQDVVESMSHPEIVEFFGRPLQSIFIEGGARLLTLFIQDELFDLAHVFLAPFILGGTQHKLFSQEKEVFKRSLLREIATVPRFQLIANERLGSDTLLEMTPKQRFSDVFY